MARPPRPRGAGVAHGARLASRSRRQSGPRRRRSAGRLVTIITSRLTRGDWNAQHLYFTGTSLTADDTQLIVIGDRDRPARGPYDPDAALNVFVVDVETGDSVRLTDNDVGVARSYVYFGGHRGRGIAPGTVAFDPATRRVFFVQDRTIRRVGIDGGAADVLAELPASVVPGYAAVSGHGERYLVPIIDEAAFADLHAIDQTVRELGLVGHILVYETSTGALVDDIAIPGGWVTHAQFRPGDPTALLFNHEWAEGSGHRRLWLRVGTRTRPLRGSEPARTDGPIDAADDVDHESWTPDGSAIVYHGTYRARGPMAGRSFVGRVTMADGAVTEVAFPAGFSRYGHLAARDGETLVTDGIAEPNAPDGETWAAAGRVDRGAGTIRLDGADAPPEDDGGRWITRIDVDWANRRMVCHPIVEHGSSWSSQDDHPHPIFDHRGTSAIFTSDRDGRRNVVRVTTTDA